MKKFNLLSSEKYRKGNSIIIVTLFLSSMLGFAALVTDIGLLSSKKAKLQNTTDAAALAAVTELVNGETNARSKAVEYIAINGLSQELFNITFPDSNSVLVAASQSVPLIFAKLMGINEAGLSVRSKAIKGNLSSAIGIRPLAVEYFQFVYNTQYILKEGAGEGYKGNFGAMALGGTGAAVYRNNLKYGYNSVIRIGDWLTTETGNMPSPTEEGIDYVMNSCTHTPKCTIENFEPDCPRVITIPVVDTLEVNGRNEVQVTGFARFLVSGYQKNDGHLEVVGYFIESVSDGDISDAARDCGTINYKLSQ